MNIQINLDLINIYIKCISLRSTVSKITIENQHEIYNMQYKKVVKDKYKNKLKCIK